MDIKESTQAHIADKTAELAEKAKTEQVWYKKVGYYLAIGAGAIVMEIVNQYGTQVQQMVSDFLSNLF